MLAALKTSLYNRLFQLGGPPADAVVLVQRRVFILPTRQGVSFALMLALMLAGSINYNLSLGFVLTFLLAAMGVNAMLLTFGNLAHLRVSGGRARPVFAGDTAHFVVHVENAGPTSRHALALTYDGRNVVSLDVPARAAVSTAVALVAARRGVLRPGRLTLYTRSPVGLFYAWSYLELDLHCIVYPRPSAAGRPLPAAALGEAGGPRRGRGEEDFSALRPYHRGDSPRHIAWKAAARDRGLLTKQFAGQAETALWLEWSALPAAMGIEERLSQLARWVLDAHEAGLSYGLRLPGVTIGLASGQTQRDRCLEALALFEPPPAQRAAPSAR